MTNQTITTLKKLAGSEDAISLVNSWMQAETAHQITKEQSEAIYREVLGEISIFNDLEVEHGRAEVERITELKDMYLSKDEVACMQIYTEVTKRMIQAGLLKEGVEISTDPCYEFWQLRHEAEEQLIEMFGTPLGITHENLWKFVNGKPARAQFLDMTIKAVVNHPNFVKCEI